MTTSIVAIGCHPDDVESGCFGTLALYRKRNVDVTILLLTGGERGGKKEDRLREAKSACSLIGAILVYADFEDGKLKDDVETVSWIEREITKVSRPSLYSTPLRQASRPSKRWQRWNIRKQAC